MENTIFQIQVILDSRYRVIVEEKIIIGRVNDVVTVYMVGDLPMQILPEKIGKLFSVELIPSTQLERLYFHGWTYKAGKDYMIASAMERVDTIIELSKKRIAMLEEVANSDVIFLDKDQ